MFNQFFAMLKIQFPQMRLGMSLFFDNESKEDVPTQKQKALQKQSEEYYDFSTNPFAKKLYESMIPKMTFKMDPRTERELNLLKFGISPFSSLGRNMLLKPNFKFNFSKKIKM